MQIFSLSCLLFLSSCRKDINFDIETTESIVLNCLFTADNMWQVSLSKSRPINQIIRFETIKDAQINLYEDDIFLTNLSSFVEATDTISIGYYTTDELTVAPSSSHTYAIKVEIGDNDILSATDIIPAKPEILSWSFDNLIYTPATILSDTNQIYGLQGDFSLQLKNNPTEKKYYAVKLFYIATTYYSPKASAPGQTNLLKDSIYQSPINFSTENNLGFKSYLLNDGFIFSDSLSNEEIVIHLHLDDIVWSKNELPEYFYVEIKAISEQYYKFQKSYLEHLQTSLNPFSTPKMVYDNITNGVGIFAGCHATLDSLKIE